jgi:predicted dehydrogenase
MSRMNRRGFLKRSALAGAMVLTGGRFAARAYAANNRVNVGVAGLHGQGGGHVSSILRLPDAAVTYLIDPDTRVFAGHLKRVQAKGGQCKCVQDVRKALDDKDLDAISIATCNHWHCLMTIWACQAGKDVYVEKPLSQNVHEGRIAVETARKHKRVVQYGTGSGSLGDSLAALARQGTYGKLLVSRGLCYKGRGSIGFKQAGDPPKELDFDIWTGPAPKQPYHGNLVHYNWHWFWDFGNGDIGNQGSHQMHAVQHALGAVTLPRSVVGIGGRFGYKDQGQTPNTQVALFDYGEQMGIFEVRGLKTDGYYGQKVGNTFHFEQGVVAGGRFYRGGGKEGEPVAKARPQRTAKAANFGEFVRCIRTRETDDFLWNIETAHYSAALCHLANISYRLGKDVPFGGSARPFGDNQAANETFLRMQDHLRDNGLKLEAGVYRVGAVLAFNAKAEKFVDNAEADALLTRPQRPPFAVPEKVV